MSRTRGIGEINDVSCAHVNIRLSGSGTDFWV